MMRNLRVLLLVWLLGFVACSDRQVRRADLLATWRLVSAGQGGQAVPYDLLVEFRPDGSLLFGTDKKDGGCCHPWSYRSDQNGVEFLPPKQLPAICAQVLCLRTELTTGIIWRIVTLTDNTLVLQSENGVLTFEAVN